MNTRRIAAIVAGLGLLVSTTLGVGGCKSSGSGASPETGASAKNALVGSLAALGRTSYAISLTTQRLTAIGSVDPVGSVVNVKAQGMRAGQPAKIEALAIDALSWARIDLGSESEQMGIDPSKWLLLDSSKLTAGCLLFDQSDPSDVFDLGDVLDGIITVRRADAEHYSGTIDLFGVRGVISLVPAGNDLGSDANNVTFTATVDPQGRLTDLNVAGGSGRDYSFDVRISDYSAAATVDQPNDVDVMTAPPQVYSLLKTANSRRSWS